MPANLTPEYRAAEEAFRQAKTPEEKLAALEEMLATIPKHKGTEKMQADIKRRISKLRRQREEKGGGPKDNPFLIERQGAGQIVMLGYPNAGKSSLLASLTNAKPVIADYPFSTALPLPGMMSFEDILIQLVDTPPITSEGIPGNLTATLQGADGYFIVVDASSDECLDQAATSLAFLRQKRLVRDQVPEGVRAVTIQECLILANKCDLPEAEDNLSVLTELAPEGVKVLPVSALRKTNLEELRRLAFRLLDVIRIYSKVPGKEPDMDAPFVMPRGSTVTDFAFAVHKDIAENLKSARVWGSARFDGQAVPYDYELEDKDVVELHAN